MWLSATRIKAYRTCPRKYKYAYRDEIPSVITAAVAFGRVMHQTLYALHMQGMEQTSIPSVEDGFAIFDELWRTTLEQEQPLFLFGGASAQAYWDLADDILRGYVKRQQHLPPPVAVEFPFHLVWEGHTLTGVVDRIDDGDNGVTVVDYKTSQRKPTAQELKEDLQLTLYALAVEQSLGRPVERIVHYHLRDQTQLSTARSQSDFRKLQQVILPRFTQRSEAQSFAPRYGYWCRFCDYRELCHAHNAQAGPRQSFGQPSLPDEEDVRSEAESDTLVRQEEAPATPHSVERRSRSPFFAEAHIVAAGVKTDLPKLANTPQKEAIAVLAAQAGLNAGKLEQVLQAQGSVSSLEELPSADAVRLLLYLQRTLREQTEEAKRPRSL